MLQKTSPEHLSPAKRAWLTRRAKQAVQADRETLKVGVATPAPAFKASRPVIDINIDHHAVGCGWRRYVVLECGPRTVRLFCYAKLVTVTIDRLTFDRKARYARDSKPEKVAEIIRRNIAMADRINADAGKIIVPDGGADAVKALEVLK